MPQLSRTDADLISYSPAPKDFIDVRYSFSLPLTEKEIEDFNYKDCILTLQYADEDYIRHYIYCDFYSRLTYEELMKAVASGTKPNLYVAFPSVLNGIEIAEKIREYHNIK